MSHDPASHDVTEPGVVHDVLTGGRDAIERASEIAWQMADGVLVLRRTVRSMPLVMSLLMVGLGYVIGTVRSGTRVDGKL